VALKKACQSASVADSTAVKVKQCISFFSPAASGAAAVSAINSNPEPKSLFMCPPGIA